MDFNLTYNVHTRVHKTSASYIMPAQMRVQSDTAMNQKRKSNLKKKKKKRSHWWKRTKGILGQATQRAEDWVTSAANEAGQRDNCD